MSKGVLKQYKNRYHKPAIQKTTPDHPPTREKTNTTTTATTPPENRYKRPRLQHPKPQETTRNSQNPRTLMTTYRS